MEFPKVSLQYASEWSKGFTCMLPTLTPLHFSFNVSSKGIEKTDTQKIPQ
jgi:hypothetical protein